MAIMDLGSSKGADIAAELGNEFMPRKTLDFEGTEKVLCETAAKLSGLTPVINLNFNPPFHISRIATDITKEETPDEQGERGVIVNTALTGALEDQVAQWLHFHV